MSKAKTKNKTGKARTPPNVTTARSHARPTVESPTWGHVRRMAAVVLAALGGPRGAAETLSYESFYTLTILASLVENSARDKKFIFGKQYLT